jgi:hypothetical protein
MREELLKLKKKLLKQAEMCQQRMLAAEKRDSWDYGYNHGAKDCAIMMVNSLNNILKNGND